MKFKLNIKWIIIATVAIIVVLIFATKGRNDRAVKVNTQEVLKKDIVEVIPANGKIQPVVEVKISPDVSGEIVELNFEEGDFVKKGDLVIKIKQDVYISMKEKAEASLNAIKAQFSQQQAQFRQIEQAYNRNKKLFDQKAISESEYETSLSQYEVAQGQLKAAEYNIKSASAALKETQENLIKTTIYSPMDGIISKMNVEKGERVVGTSQMAGTELFRVANLNDMEVLVDVNENDIVRLSQNDTAEIEVDAYPGKKFTGVVTQIANSAKNIGGGVDQVTNFEVKIRILPVLDSKNGISNLFRPGMSASVSIKTETKFGALSVPLQAITTRSDLKKDTVKKEGDKVIEQVFVMIKDTVQVREITTGIQDLNNIEVVSGLKEGEVIVTGPYAAISKTLKSGSKVEKIDKDKEKNKNNATKGK
jgi:HlyD family secretion protein